MIDYFLFLVLIFLLVRFYHGYRCPDPVSASTSLGSLLIFDYKLLHRGPGNSSPKPRPMVSMVFTKLWFVNVEAFVNRAISFTATLHQRRFWEQFVWHPEQEEEFWKV